MAAAPFPDNLNEDQRFTEHKTLMLKLSRGIV